jgi:hypothetical protein
MDWKQIMLDICKALIPVLEGWLSQPPPVQSSPAPALTDSNNPAS